MDFELTPSRRKCARWRGNFAEREVGPVIRDFDEKHEFPHEILSKLAGTGLLGGAGAGAVRRAPRWTTSPTRSRSKS
jgi:hypothetical protein